MLAGFDGAERHAPAIHFSKNQKSPLPKSVFGGNLQCEPVRKVDTREECHWSHACPLQASRRGNQWHPRVQLPVEKTRTVHQLLHLSHTGSFRLSKSVVVVVASSPRSNRGGCVERPASDATAVPYLKNQKSPFSVRTRFTVQTDKRSGHPRGMSLVTRMFA